MPLYQHGISETKEDELKSENSKWNRHRFFVLSRDLISPNATPDHKSFLVQAAKETLDV